MKPRWDDAPDWAQWLAKDHVGFAFFEIEPEWDEKYGWQVDRGLVTGGAGNFDKTLEARP